MRNLSSKSAGELFASANLRQVLDAQIDALQREVEGIDGERFLNTSPGDLADYLVAKFTIQPLALRRDEWSVEAKETRIDVSEDPNRLFFPGDSKPYFVPGQYIEIEVPFDGDPNLFYAQASKFSNHQPRAKVRGNTLVLGFTQPNNEQQRNIRGEADALLVEIQRHIDWVNADVAAMNNALPHNAGLAIEGRKQRLLTNQNRVASLGIPIRERVGAAKTYAIPVVRKKAEPVMPAASSAPYEPEPAWEMAQYEHALEIILNMALVMERSPSAFLTLDEEAIRQMFLIQLNGQFEGRATGETFNFGGKTDILLRERGRNVFIAECKFWKGRKKFAEAIDQLLGYTSWRDSKTAILVFNRGTEMSTVLAGVDASMRAHANFKRALTWPREDGFRYVLHQTGDLNRELIVSVLVFHIPTTGGNTA